MKRWGWSNEGAFRLNLVWMNRINANEIAATILFERFPRSWELAQKCKTQLPIAWDFNDVDVGA